MSSPIDLVTLNQLKQFMAVDFSSLVSVNTTITAPIAAGKQTVAPLSMANISTNRVLTVDTDAAQETIKVLAVTATTFDAIFSQAHAAGAVVIATEDAILGPLITDASAKLLELTGKITPGVIPAVSPFLSPVAHDDWYDGTPNVQFLGDWPIASVGLVELNGVTVPPSTGYSVNGYLISRDQTHLVWRGQYCTVGSMNVHVQFNAGYTAAPPRIVTACMQLIQDTYRRRGYADLSSVSLPEGGGTTSYRSWAIRPEVRDVIRDYSRRAV